MTDSNDEQVVEKSVTDATPEELAEVAKSFSPEQVAAVAEALDLVEKGKNPFAKKDDEDEEDDDDEDDKKGKNPFANLKKSLRGEQVELFKSLEAQVVALQKAADESKQAAAIEKALRLDASAIEKSKSDYANLSIEHEKVAPALRKMRETDAETAGVFDTLLKALNAQAGESPLFKELGTPAGAAGATTAFGQITTIAKSLVTEGKARNEAEGIAQALDARPDLYSAYVKGE